MKSPIYNAKPYVYTKKKSSDYMRVPSISGDYTLRWFNRGDRKTVLAERPITLIAPEIKLTAPDEAIAGTEIELSWTAPKDLESFINIQLSDEKPYYSAKYYIYTEKNSSDYLRLPSKAATIPEEPGDYIFRWYNTHDRTMMVEKEVKVTLRPSTKEKEKKE